MRMSVRLAAIVALASVSVLPFGIARAQETAPPIKVTVIGQDGKPVEDVEVKFYKVGQDYDSKSPGTSPGNDQGDVYIVQAKESKTSSITKVVYAPKDQGSGITLKLEPYADLNDVYARASNASRSGDVEGYEAAMSEAEAIFKKEDDVGRQMDQANEVWAQAHGIGGMTLEELRKKIKKAEKIPEEARDPVVFARLKAYERKFETRQAWTDSGLGWRRSFRDLKRPAKKVVVAPGACPEGQSGGFLAGLLNSVTGSNSVTGICGEEIEKDNKDRKPRDREEHGRD